jgi:hypothetical protein
MSIGQRSLGIVLLAASGVVFPQTTETKVPDFSSTGPTNGLSSAIGANARRNKVKGVGSAEILTDTMGVDFGP